MHPRLRRLGTIGTNPRTRARAPLLQPRPRDIQPWQASQPIARVIGSKATAL